MRYNPPVALDLSDEPAGEPAIVQIQQVAQAKHRRNEAGMKFIANDAIRPEIHFQDVLKGFPMGFADINNPLAAQDKPPVQAAIQQPPEIAPDALRRWVANTSG